MKRTILLWIVGVLMLAAYTAILLFPLIENDWPKSVILLRSGQLPYAFFTYIEIIGCWRELRANLAEVEIQRSVATTGTIWSSRTSRF